MSESPGAAEPDPEDDGPWEEDAPRFEFGRRTVVMGLVLLALALMSWVGHTVAEGGGRHSWDTGALPAPTQLVTVGRTYTLSDDAGIDALATAQDTSDPQLTCSYAGANGESGGLDVQTTSTDSRVLHQLGTFQAPLSDDIAVTCEGTGPVFIDDADNRTFDTAGLLVLVTIGLGLAGVLTVLSGFSSGFTLQNPENIDDEPPPEPRTPQYTG